MRTKARLKRMEAIIAETIFRALEANKELEQHYATMRARGWKLDTMIGVVIKPTPPPLKHAPKKYGARDRAFLEAIGVDPDRVAR